MAARDDAVRRFLGESSEKIDLLNRSLLLLESNPSDMDSVESILDVVRSFRIHSGILRFDSLEAVTRTGESLLDLLHREGAPVSEIVITTLLCLAEFLSASLSRIERTGTDAESDCSVLLAAFTDLAAPGCGAYAPSPSHSPEISPLDTSGGDPSPTPLTPLTPATTEDEEQIELEKLFEMTRRAWETEPVTETVVPDASSQSELPNNSRSSRGDSGATSEARTDLPTEHTRSEIADSSLRVDVSLLDKLMNLVGELVLARNQILQFTKSQSDGELLSASQRLNLITSELQDGVMRTRMQPIATVWNKLPRVVRDVAHACGKQVRLEMDGKETELDKTIIEAIKDPLTHVIRNAVDHGIEPAAHRSALGKHPEGVLRLRAFHEGGQVIIEIADDGCGLDTEKIRGKAIEKGLIPSVDSSPRTENDINRLIFLPGFSTADRITSLSGRGVGMDVVRSNIERIGGAVDVASVRGQGTTFTIKIPLTLAIIPALIVTTSESRYAIPQVNLLELVRLEGDQIAKSIERVHQSDFYRLRGSILPLVYLERQLSPSPDVRCSTSTKSDVLSLVVVQADGHRFGLVVNSIQDTEEIVVKPLGRLLKGLSVFSGATIMGDGQVALILDIVGLAREAQINKKDSIPHELDPHEQAEQSEARRKLFVFEVGVNRRGAVPLEDVYRLEEFEIERIESAGEHQVIQYRDGILPLIDLRTVLGRRAGDTDGHIRAFVHRSGDSYVGFVVDRIIDIVEQPVRTETAGGPGGLLGSAIIQKRVTDLLDLQAILASANLDDPAQRREQGEF